MFTNARAFQNRMEFGNVGFQGEGKTGVPREKTSWSRVENQQQTQPTYMYDTGSRNQPRTHWWEASALTTAPFLLPDIPALDRCGIKIC